MTPFDHLSDDSHINCPLRAGPITASRRRARRGRPNAGRLSCRAKSYVRSESVGVKSHRFWRRRIVIVVGGRSVRKRCASCGCADAQGISESRNHARMRKSPTSVWRHSMSSTTKMPDHRGAAKGWREAAGRAPITRQETMLIRPRFVRSRSRTGTCRSTFRKACGKHDQAQPPTQH